MIRFLEDNHVELYDLSKDIAERTDLAQEKPAEARQLNDRLTAYLKAIDAQLPEKNPDFDPNAPAPERKGGKGGGGKAGAMKGGKSPGGQKGRKAAPKEQG